MNLVRHCSHVMIRVFLVTTLWATAPALLAQATSGADTGMKGQAEKKISELLGVPVTVRDYQLDYSTLRLKGVVIGDRTRKDQLQADIHEVSATCNFMSLLAGSLVLEDVALASVSVRIPWSPAASLERVRPAASSTTRFDPATFPVKKVRGTSLEVRLDDPRHQKSLALRLPAIEVTKADDLQAILIQLSGALRTISPKTGNAAPECSVRASIAVSGTAPFVGSATVDAGPAPVAEIQNLVEVFLPGSAAMVACKGGAAEANITFSQPGQKPGQIQAKLILRGLDLKPPTSGQSIRNLHGELRFNGTMQNGAANGVLDATRLRATVGTLGEISLEKAKARFENFGAPAGTMHLEETVVAALGTTLRLSGSIKPSGTPQLRLLAGSKLDLADMQKRLAGGGDPRWKQLTMAGTAELMVDVTGSLAAPIVRGGFQLSNGTIAIPERKIRLQNTNLSISVDESGATIKTASGLIAGGQLTVTGTVKGQQQPVLNLNGSVKQAVANELLGLLASVAPSFPRDLKLSGPIDLEFGATGPLAKPVIQGACTLSQATLEMPVLMRPCTDLTGAIQLTATGLQTKGLQARWGGSAFRVSGQVKDLSTFHTDLQFTVKPLDVTDLASFFLKDSGYKVSGSGEAEGRMSGPAANLTITGTTRVPSGEVSMPLSSSNSSVYSAPYQNLSSGFRYAGGKLAFNDAQASVFGGQLQGNCLIDPRARPIRFDLQLTGKALRTEAFLAENTSQKQVITGPVDGRFVATGDTTGLTSWNGSGSLSLRNGTYQAPPVVTPILSMLNLKQFASGDLTSADGTFVLNKIGRAHV